MTEAVDIESIVREVLRRLQAITRSPSDPTAPTAQQTSTQAVLAEMHTLTLLDRLVTISSLEGRLTDIRQISVDRKAIVTPAVRDELKRRRIAIARQDSATTVTTQVRLLAAIADGAKSTTAVRTAVSGAVAGVEWLECQATHSLAGVVAELSQHAFKRQLPGLLLTSQPLLAAALANRNPAIRAATVTDIRSLDEAIQQIGANIAVVDIRVSPFALKTIAGRFAEAQPVVPAELQTK